MSRRLLAVLLGGVLLGTGLTGCGIPDNSGVQVDGRGPAAESGSLNGGVVEPPTHTASRDPKEFILNYLQAAAGEREQAYERVKEFIAPGSRSLLREKHGSEITLTVVRLWENPEVTPNSDGSSVVKIKVQQVGVLRTDGSLAPPVASETEYQFTLRPAPSSTDADDPELLITDLPNVLLLNDESLQKYYGIHTIYFWNSDQTRLVPDQRYLPSAVPGERRVTEVVRWLAGGPSDWLAQGVIRLPDGTQLINNATGANGHWEVNLNMPGANDARLGRLATQLAWSLPELDGQLDLKIQNQKRLTVDLKQERLTHPVYLVSGNPERFSVYDGAIHPLSLPGEVSGPVPVGPAANKRIISAALSRSGDKVLAALVVSGSDGRQRLLAGSGPGPVTVFNGGGPWYKTLGRPVWLRSLDPQHPHGLVVAGGDLYRFDGQAVMKPVSLGVPGKVTAVAASLEGHRIALIIDGALYVAAVNLDGGVVTVGQPRRLVTRMSDLSAVDWGTENQLIFAGSEERPGIYERRPAIYETSVDGALDTALKRDIGARVTHLAAYSGSSTDLVFMYEANKVAYRNTPYEPIKREQVLDVTPPAGGKASNPTAPFFLY
ncbi:hypothetical protein DLE60_05375 [Micromonospora globispora]|uniref:GerMN domain-containing protein n=1 Tax=Micromonospora globispora TaxID=1450148 RepID=A0A317KBL1_9ACTN|nr:LpqB family beta-propeller domain-containing protein [Micromonospora globispora]PWU50872.1 hypothetical protein DLJ46_06075 [Micromonospora globispora]PWU61491.1 hypothetical protein DLE60_05375 [Micromonospora globispora]RQW82498.1 hypothetical protein DKL51_33105 [Micromonospora globispora]